MKRGDVVRVTTGDHAGQMGRVICVFGGWASVSLPDGFTFGVKEAACEKPTDSATGITLPTVGSHSTNPFADREVCGE